jgi:hypothetical protein
VPEYLFGLAEKAKGVRRRHGKNQWEPWITDEIARRCGGVFDPQTLRYPASAIQDIVRLDLPRGTKRPQGDLLLALDGSMPIFVECKSIFECVLAEKPIVDGQGRCYRYDYRAESVLTDAKHAMTCVSIEEAWIDARKLNCLWQPDEEPKCHLGLLLLEFDRKGRELSNRRDYTGLEHNLLSDRWRQTGRKSWDDIVPIRAEKGFREHLVLWTKEAGVST